MYNKIIREYYRTVKVLMESFREIGTKYGYSKDFVNGQFWELQGIELAFYGLAVRSGDCKTADYIWSHSRKLQDRIKKIGIK